MTAAEIDPALRAQIVASLRAGRPHHEILTLLMSNGFREAEAAAVLEKLKLDAPSPTHSVSEPSAPSFPFPMVAGAGLIVAGIAMYVGTGRSSIWFFVLGAAAFAAGLAQIASGND